MTISQRRQQTTTHVAKDIEPVDHAADEVHDQPQEAVADDVHGESQGFPDRPHDIIILMDYVHHVAIIVWNGDIFIFKNI